MSAGQTPLPPPKKNSPLYQTARHQKYLTQIVHHGSLWWTEARHDICLPSHVERGKEREERERGKKSGEGGGDGGDGKRRRRRSGAAPLSSSSSSSSK